MRSFLIVSILVAMGLFSIENAQARPIYITNFVPTALAQLGVTPNGWSTTTCTQCHGAGAAAFTNISAGASLFGTQVFTTATNMGFVMTANAADDLTAAQIQMVIQAVLPLDADGDGVTNEAELRGRSDFNDRTSTPASVGGGPSDDPCSVVPALCAAGGGAAGVNGKIVSADAAYQLNSGCGAAENRAAQLAGASEMQTASVPAPIAGVLLMWLLPLLVGVWRRRD